MIDDGRRGRSVVTLELCAVRLEIEGRLLPWSRLDGVCRYRPETDDTRKLRKAGSSSAKRFASLRVSYARCLSAILIHSQMAVLCQRIVGKW